MFEVWVTNNTMLMVLKWNISFWKQENYKFSSDKLITAEYLRRALWF
jgi:hypothetical protein